jgi:hypothetical protein
MPWFKVDDTLAMHPKAVAAGASLALWVRAGCWSAQQLTDGFVPTHMVAALGGKASDARRLVEVGLWEDKGTGYLFHDWADYQPSRVKVMEKREAGAERLRRYRETRRNSNTETEA